MMHTNRFDVVIFDLGGVLIRYRKKPRILDWLGDRMTLQDLWTWWLSSDLVRNYETGKISSETFAEGIVAAFGLPVSKEEYLESFALSHEAVYDGAEELLGMLASRFELGVLSNTNEILWNRCASLGIFKYFRHLFASHHIGFVKPDRRIYEHVLRVLNIPPERILFFDDQQVNVAIARELGIEAHLAAGLTVVREKLAELQIV